MVKRMAVCGGNLYVAVGSFDSASPVVKIYRSDDPGCMLWRDVTPTWNAPADLNDFALLYKQKQHREGSGLRS